MFKQTFKDLMFRFTREKSDAQQMCAEADVPVSLCGTLLYPNMATAQRRGSFIYLFFIFVNTCRR